MAARENQLLQIALIIFVAITVILGVATFIIARRGGETEIKLAQQKKVAEDALKKSDDRATDVKTLKDCIGAADAETVNDVNERFKKDMTAWAGAFPDKNKYYRSALEYMFTALKKSDDALAVAKQELEKFKVQFVGREATRDPEIKQHQAAVTKSAADYADEREKFTTELAGLKRTEADAAQGLKLARSENEKAIAKYETVIQEKTGQIAKGQIALIDKQKENNRIKQIAPSKITGKVVWSSQATGTVWINLGQADALKRRTTFGVYSGDALDVGTEKKKASVEVAQILGTHLAEARVLNDNAIDPILPGDRVWTTIWSPGDRKHFALAGKMDIYGDGRDHLKDLRNSIAASGGIIDEELDIPTATTRGPKMTTSTDYLVVGEPPTATSNADLLKIWTEMQKRAQSLGIEQIQVKELMKQMGSDAPPIRSVRLGPGATEAELRPTPPPGGIQTTNNPVSPIFMPREPPKAEGASAY